VPRARNISLLLSLAVVLAQAERTWAAEATVEFTGGFPRTTKTNIYPLKSVKRGDKGIGYTVFAADKITPFDVEVLGVLEGFLGPHKDLILARLSGKEIEFTGVIAGMSGSPVYVDGKLMGAVSYRMGSFAKEAIAGITPIESMLAVYGTEGKEPPAQAGATLFPSGNQSERLVPNRPRGIRVADFREKNGLPATTLPKQSAILGPYDARPIETPIAIAGLEPSVSEQLRQKLLDAGFVSVPSGGASGRGIARRDKGERKVDGNKASFAGTVPAAPIAPGAPLAAVLMRGDVYLAAYGTTTFVDGDEVLAFGHPFFGFGHVAFPMATASIINTLASQMGSFKQGEAALEVGSITHDRLTAIAGRIGGVAPMIPVHVRVSRSARDPEGGNEARVEVIKDPSWAPTLVDAIIASTAQARLSNEVGGTIDFEARVEVGDRTLRVTDTYSAEAPMQVSAFVARDIANTVGLIAHNNAFPADIRAVEADLSVKQQISLATIEQVIPDHTVVKPGERLSFTVRLRPYKKDPVLVRMEAEIPRDAKGDLELYVGGGVELDRRDGEVYGERFPTNLDELLGILAERRPSRAIYARTYMQRGGLKADAELLSSLPPAERQIYAGYGGRTTRAVTEAMGPANTMPYGDVVGGGVSIALAVTR
jgi:hypothetical protein